MKIQLFCLNIIILIFLHLVLIDCAEKVPQIKVIGTQIVSLNSEYNEDIVYTIKRFNETFNHLSVYWSLKKDLPKDTKVFMKVYVTDATFQHGTLVLENITPVCEPDKNHELLPNILQVPESAFNTQCLKKGLYQADYLEQYRFEVLVPNIESMGNYYRVEYEFGNDSITVGSVIFYCEWGYLHSSE